MRAITTFVTTANVYLMTTFSFELIIANWSTLRRQKTPKTATPIDASNPATHTVPVKIII